MTANQASSASTPTNTSTLSPRSIRLLDPNDRVHVLAHLNRRAASKEEIDLLDRWMGNLAEHIDIFIHVLRAETQDTNDDFLTLNMQHKFGSSHYRIPALLYRTIVDAFDVVFRAKDARDYESMMVHLRVAQHLIDLIYTWGYGEHVNTLTGERILFSNENAYGATVDEVLRPEKH